MTNSKSNEPGDIGTFNLAIVTASFFISNVILLAAVIGVSFYQVINVHSYDGQLVSISTIAFMVMVSYSLILSIAASNKLLALERSTVDSYAKASQLTKVGLKITSAGVITYGFILIL